MSKITINEVAKMAGVSSPTVSRVINKYPYVKKETYNRVMEAIGKLNFVPSAVARNLVMGRSLLQTSTLAIGLLFGFNISRSHTYFSKIVDIIERELRKKNYYLIFSKCDEFVPSMVRDEVIQGIIILSHVNPETLAALKQKNVPVVLVDSDPDIEGAECIIPDFQKGVSLALSYLIGLGHKRIGMINGPLGHYFSQASLESYKGVLEKNSIAFDASIVVDGDFSLLSGYQAMKQLLSLPSPPTAVFANDETAIGAMRAIEEKGLKIPKDIALVGFDDIDLSSYTIPSLTTIRVSREKIGELAVKKMFDWIAEKEKHVPTKTIVPVELVVRNSA